MKLLSRDAWKPLRKCARTGVELPPMPLRAADVAKLERAYVGTPHVPTPLSTAQHGPVPAGADVLLHEANTDPSIPPQFYMLHCGMTLLDGLINDLDLPVALAGLWNPPEVGHLQLAVWFDFKTSRLLVLPHLRLHGRTLSMQLSHIVWLHQGWMTGHDPSKDEDWADMSTNHNAYMFRQGYAYDDVGLAWGQKRYHWGFYKSPFDRLLHLLFGRWTRLGDGEVVLGCADIGGLPILRSEEHQSFFHFSVGEPACATGSEVGVALRRVRTYMVEASQAWGSVYSSIPELEIHVEIDRGAERRIRERE